MTKPTSMIFASFDEAWQYAADGAGGWLCRSQDGKRHQWFDPAHWTQTAIIEATSHFGNREIGTYPMFNWLAHDLVKIPDDGPRLLAEAEIVAVPLLTQS